MINDDLIYAFLRAAEADRTIKSALQLLKDAVNFCRDSPSGHCYLAVRYFAQKYNVSARTVRRWKQLLISHGYLLARAEAGTFSLNFALSAMVTSGPEPANSGPEPDASGPMADASDRHYKPHKPYKPKSLRARLMSHFYKGALDDRF